MEDLKLYGPPGTGKTHSGIGWLGDRIAEGRDLRSAAFVSFTRAGCYEGRDRVCERFSVEPEEMPYCATIHALAKRTVGVGGKGWLADEQIEKFAAEYEFDIKKPRKKGGDDGDLDATADHEGEDAPYLRIWHFGRNRMRFDAPRAWDCFMEYEPYAAIRLSYTRFVEFVESYEKWKADNWLRDFTDLLIEVVEHPQAIPVSVAIIDEVQDNSPLLWAAADVLFADAELRGVLGDDDQAVFGFQGAEPSLMNERSAREVRLLDQSYRLPARVAELAQRIIAQNSNRQFKPFRARNADGELDWVPTLESLKIDAPVSKPGILPWFILIRNWRLFDYVKQELEGMGVPYRVSQNRKHSPWNDTKQYGAVKAIMRLSDGAPVSLAEVAPLVSCTRADMKDRPGVWRYGEKKRLETRAAEQGGDRVTFRDLPSLGMTRWGLERVLRRDFSILAVGVPETDVQAYQRALVEGRMTDKPPVEVSSVHGAKGREAERVCVVLGCTGAVRSGMQRWERMEEERRIAYVAATRARTGLYVRPSYVDPLLHEWDLIGV